ncbi:MAG: GntR family transcriptional regulator [Lentisphaerota bacterium]
MTKIYKKYQTVKEDLAALVKSLASSGKYLLPPERELAVMQGASRMTLRKALDELISDGLIRRGGRKNEIVNSPGLLRNCGRILFVASGVQSAFHLHALERLWLNFAPMAKQQGADISLLLTDSSTSFNLIKAQLSQADVVLVSPFKCNVPHEELIAYLKELETQKLVIAMTEYYSGTMANIVSLDNYAAGEMAAEALVKSGYRKIFLTGYDLVENSIDKSFVNRIAGFSNVLKQHGLLRKSCIRLIEKTAGDYGIKCREILSRAAADGEDAVFFYSDESIQMIVADICASGAVPDQFGIIALNGSGDSLRNIPPVSCVSHATLGVAAALLNALADFSLKRLSLPVKLLIKPELYDKGTIRNLKKQKPEIRIKPKTGNQNFSSSGATY